VNDATWDGATKVTRWYALSDVEVQAPRNVGALVAIGDSITDGYGVPAGYQYPLDRRAGGAPAR
jgi:hypothetical protein